MTGEVVQVEEEIETVPDEKHGGPAYWMDEFWSFILAFPMLASFFPYAQDFVSRGFVILGQAPGWYLGAVGLSIAWAFGRKALVPIVGGISKPR